MNNLNANAFNNSRISIILNTDSYKASHYLQYPENTTYISSYIESRGGTYNKTVFFGLQIFIKEYLTKPFTRADMVEAEEIFIAHGLPYNREGWEYIFTTCGGYLPIEIQAVPEGSVIDTKNVLVQVINTDPKCAWLTSYVETSLLRAIWYPTTVATVSYECKSVIKRFLEETADTTEGLPFKLHDFGARGASSEETAAIGGLAHMVNFVGSDTLSGIIAGRRYYNAQMAGFSIPAAEHSTITSWGKDNEAAAYANMLDQFSSPGKLVAVVSDSYDLWNAIENIWGDELKNKIIQSGGTLVVRPDSGDPVTIVTETLERLMRLFGSTTNSKGFRVLPDYIRVIQSDGVSLETIKAVLEAMKTCSQSADNVAFGMGGELLQKVNRDTQRFAMKASAAKVDGLWRDVYKDPITDQGKRSKRGRLALIKDNEGNFKTIRQQDLGSRANKLITIFKNGKIIKEYTLEEVRERTNQ